MAETTPVVPQGKHEEQTDPSALATQALWREVAHLKELVFNRLDSLRSAIDELHNDLNRLRESLQTQILDESRLRDEKFSSIQTQFRERDVRVEQTARDTKVAVDAALQAAEKARTSSNEAFDKSIFKSETATTKQIDQLAVQMNTSTNGLMIQITDVKERLTRIEGKGEGMHAGWGYLVGAIGLIGAIIAIFFALRG